MKAKFLPAVLAVSCLLLSQGVFSQQRQHQNRKNEEIVISRNPADTGKTIIEIDSNVVTINGQPLEDYKGDVKVFKRNFMGGNDHEFISPGPQSFMFDENSGNAFLGVLSAKTEKGAIINNVLDHSSAKESGLKKGDIITKVNDKEITSPADLRNVIGSFNPGDEVTINYLRNDKKNSVKVKLRQIAGKCSEF